METRRLGTSGLEVSLVGLGCNNFGGRSDFDATKRVVERALDLGITLFDTADIYSRGASEEYLGRALGTRRKDVVLATKFAKPMDDDGTLRGTSRRYVIQAVEASLQRLKTDWIDLYQIHEPDQQTPIDETLRALDDLVRQGKVRYIGTSNYAAWQVVEAQLTARAINTSQFISFQDEYSLLVRGIEKELIPAASAYGMGLLPYFPLACGLLTGKYRRNAPMPEGARITTAISRYGRYLTDTNWDRVERLTAFAKERGHGLLELAFSWLAAKLPVASVIAGATKPEQIEQNVRAVEWKLDPDELSAVDEMTA